MVKVVPYDPLWPQIFAQEAETIKKALGPGVEVHHIGSTSVPGLMAKPKIDVMAVVPKLGSLLESNEGLEHLGYQAKGELNIPFRLFFSKRTAALKINLHVYEVGNPDTDLHLLFRDALRNSPALREEYMCLKKALLSQAHLHEKTPQGFPGYTLGKDAFIKKVLEQAGFQGYTLRLCMHDDEWKAARTLRNMYASGSGPSADTPFLPLQSENEFHIVFYKGAHIIGYAHSVGVGENAIFSVFELDKTQSTLSEGATFRALCERWLKQKEYRN